MLRHADPLRPALQIPFMLPTLRPQPPWFGYSLGDWLPEWHEAAQRAVKGRYLENGRISEGQRRKGVKSRTVTGGSDYQ